MGGVTTSGNAGREGCDVRLTREIAEQYIKDLKKEFATRAACEISYRTPLKKMIEGMTSERILAQVESKGRSDIMLFLRGRTSHLHSRQVGMIETKTMEKRHGGSKLTDLIKKNGEQLKKHLKSERVIVFTNYIEFAILELDPNTNEIEVVDTCQLLARKNFESKSTNFIKMRHVELEKLFSRFIREALGTGVITTQKDLACHLACSARELSESVIGQIKRLEKGKRSEVKNLGDPVYVFYRQYKHLTRAEDPAEIANAFGQTISCGLFLAKLNADLHYPNSRLTRSTAVASIPISVPVIRELFYIIGGPELPKYISRVVTQIIDALNQTDMEKIRSESPDVFLYFYEEFLKAFDKKARAQMGVYYTPIEIVDYICKRVNRHLKDEFGKSFGFGDAGIRTLDPATGTGTFLVRAIELAICENSSGMTNGGGGAQATRMKSSR